MNSREQPGGTAKSRQVTSGDAQREEDMIFDRALGVREALIKEAIVVESTFVQQVTQRIHAIFLRKHLLAIRALLYKVINLFL